MTTDDSTPGDSTPTDPTPENVDEPEAELLPDDPSEGVGPEIPTVPDVSKNDVPQELRKQFWTLVMLFNIALLGMSLGVMLVGFERRWTAGGAFFAVGALAFVRGWRGYKRVTSDGWSWEADSDDDGTSGDDPAVDANDETGESSDDATVDTDDETGTSEDEIGDADVRND